VTRGLLGQVKPSVIISPEESGIADRVRKGENRGMGFWNKNERIGLERAIWTYPSEAGREKSERKVSFQGKK